MAEVRNSQRGKGMILRTGLIEFKCDAPKCTETGYSESDAESPPGWRQYYSSGTGRWRMGVIDICPDASKDHDTGSMSRRR